MRAVLKLVAAFCLIAGLMVGSIAHAAEIGSVGEVTAATEWLHADGDHDQVPADADRNYPHHHNVCHGHDVGTPFKACLPFVTASCAHAVAGSPLFVLVSGPSARHLRPPIA